ncbi:MAG: excinuclease ABC subunit UvrC [Spirochaetota bacterium]|jgi:excinuclease ABC subunit C|nr:excinuclease ABC subunit UvrC [Spirochaetota bacterium]
MPNDENPCADDTSKTLHLAQKAQSLPDLPGVYIMRDSSGQILYIGKAKRLCRRAASYFNKTQESAKTRALIAQIANIDHIVAASESEALLLESNLIKEHHPRYNIQLRDSKRYPWLAASIGEDFPRFFKTRLPGAPENQYFGPYPSVAVIRNTIALLHRLFRFRYCHKKLLEGKPAPPLCFYARIRRCPAPCEGMISKADYRKNIEGALLFLEGKQEELRIHIENEMRARSLRLDYEGAAVLRDQLAAIMEASQAQAVCRLPGDNLPMDIDIAAMAEGSGAAACAIFAVRGGKLVAQHLWLEENAGDKPELFAQFLKQHYAREKHKPKYIMLQRKQVEDEPDEAGFLDMLLLESQTADPGLRSLARQAEKNAFLALEDEMKRRLHDDGLETLRQLLGLPSSPRDIEAFDIANTLGEANVAACVHFKNGRPDTKNYRRFIIRSVAGQDDFASIQEAVGRRYQRLVNENKPLPDLVLIDGGRGQLHSAREALLALGLGTLPIAALAKKEELLFLPDREEPLALDRHHYALRLLQTIRDEVHRFVNTYHAEKRDTAHSALEDIPGIGPAARKKLLAHFGSLAGVRSASPEELIAVLGGKRAESLKRALVKHIAPNE